MITLRDKIESLRMKYHMRHREIVHWLIRTGSATDEADAEEILMRIDDGGDE